MQKGVYPYEYMDGPYEYMDGWETFNETSLSEKEDFYSRLNMEDINEADYAQAKILRSDFEIRTISWLVCSKQYIIVSWCVWELKKYVSSNIWAWSW